MIMKLEKDPIKTRLYATECARARFTCHLIIQLLQPIREKIEDTILLPEE
jgi:hypothetical protein